MTVAFAVPPIARALARDPLVDRYDLSSLRLILLSAAPCPADLERECQERLGCTIAQALGMTEAAPITLPFEPARHGSAGQLAPSTGAVVVDPDSGAWLDADATGELWVRGPQLMRGYLGDELAPPDVSTPTGGCTPATSCASTADGDLYVIDRLKELIKVRGYHVAPAQLEAELMSHPAVRRCCGGPAPR